MIHIVAADNQHCNMILEWRNDKDSRKNFFNSNIILFEDHKKWYDNYIKDNPNRLLMCKLKDNNVCMVRFDNVYNNESYKVSINMNPDYRGKKLSAKCLGEAIQFFIKHNKWEVWYIYADIKPSNIASMKCFERNKFVLWDTGTYWLDLT